MNQNKDRMMKIEYITMCFILHLMILYMSLHIGYMTNVDEEIFFVALVTCYEHIMSNPFQMFPTDWTVIFFFQMVCVIADIFAMKMYELKRNSYRDKEYGTRRFMTEKDMSKFRQEFFYDPKIVEANGGNSKTVWLPDELKSVCKKTKHSKKIYAACFMACQILAQGIYMSMNCKFINRNLNTLTIGGSGQGKSYSELFPNALNANCNYIFTDPSGEILMKMGKFLRNEGYKIKVFNVDDFSCSQRYNLFAYIEEEEDYNIVVDALIKNIKPDKKPGGTNEFFDDGMTSLICAVFAYLKEHYKDKPEKQTMASVMELLRMAKQEIDVSDPTAPQTTSKLRTLFEEHHKEFPRSYAYKMFCDFEVGGPKVCNEIIISATAVLGRYFNSDRLANLTLRDELHLEEIATEEKCALFLIIPNEKRTYNFLVSMIYSQLFSICMKEGKRWREKRGSDNPALPRHLSFWLDEFYACGKIPNFLEMISVVRKYNISCNVIVQAQSQLDTMYPDGESDIIVANTDTMIYLGGQDPKSIENLSKKLGEATIKSHSYNLGKSNGESYQNMARHLMKAEEIEEMSRAYELVFISGQKPFKARKYNLKEHPNYSKCGEASKENLLFISQDFKLEMDEEAIIEATTFDFVEKTKNVEQQIIPEQGISPDEMTSDMPVLSEAEKEERKLAQEMAAMDGNNVVKILKSQTKSEEELFQRFENVKEFVPDFEFVDDGLAFGFLEEQESNTDDETETESYTDTYLFEEYVDPEYIEDEDDIPDDLFDFSNIDVDEVDEEDKTEGNPTGFNPFPTGDMASPIDIESGIDL